MSGTGHQESVQRSDGADLLNLRRGLSFYLRYAFSGAFVGASAKHGRPYTLKLPMSYKFVPTHVEKKCLDGFVGWLLEGEANLERFIEVAAIVHQ